IANNSTEYIDEFALLLGCDLAPEGSEGAAGHRLKVDAVVDDVLQLLALCLGKGITVAQQGLDLAIASLQELADGPAIILRGRRRDGPQRCHAGKQQRYDQGGDYSVQHNGGSMTVRWFSLRIPGKNPGFTPVEGYWFNNYAPPA